MTASETAGSCIAAAVGILLLAPAVFDVWHKRRTRRRFQTSARQAEDTEQQVAANVAAIKAKRETEQRAIDQKFAQLIAVEFPAIPHQTRRTEDDQ